MGVHKPALYVDSTPLLDDREALRARAEDDGYLFFRQLIPREDILAVRRDMLRIFDRFGWRDSSRDSVDGTIDLPALDVVPEEAMRTDIGVSIAAYDATQKLESFHRLPHHPKLLAFYQMLFGTEVLVHPRHIARMITSHHSMVPTPPHQDFPLIQGTEETWTAWIPLGDCPREMGGLTVLKGSHRNGYVPIRPSRGAGGIAVQLCPRETEWVEGDFRAGDVLTFPSFTVHKALRCRYKDQVRLSLDVRYQSVEQPVEEASLRPHCELAWPEVYENWKDDEFQYYWRKFDLTLKPKDPTLIQPSRRIC